VDQEVVASGLLDSGIHPGRHRPAHRRHRRRGCDPSWPASQGHSRLPPSMPAPLARPRAAMDVPPG
jgi:hypothetical protein